MLQEDSSKTQGINIIGKGKKFVEFGIGFGLNQFKKFGLIGDS